MIILGVDPGSKRVGYGLLEKTGAKLNLLDAGLLEINKPLPLNLLEIESGLTGLIKKFRPERMAIEKLFFMNNQKTGIEVSQARGVILLSALKNKIKISEYAPNEVKLAVSGYGLADKKAVEKMVKLILNKPDLKLIDDAVDALALAITGASRLD
ncbi:MAG: crossover junction endodeoxyribonuclease RuvC [Patescibacteria group bacterium]|nr:crossover junction endodeoxyribonuclease RuvC [Patescibacteria group bacterium]